MCVFTARLSVARLSMVGLLLAAPALAQTSATPPGAEICSAAKSCRRCTLALATLQVKPPRHEYTSIGAALLSGRSGLDRPG